MDFIFFLFSHKFFSFCLLFVLSSSFLIIRKVLQRYTFLHKTSGNENISVLNFIKSNNLKVISHKNSVRTASLPNSNAIPISTYQCLSYHNLKGLHISELQAAIFRCLEQLLLVNCLDGYLYLLVGKFLEILLGLLLLIEEVLIDLSKLG